MFAAFLSNILEAYRAPRASARALLSRNPTMADAIKMLALSYVISEFIGRLMAGGAVPFSLPAMIVGLVTLLLGFAITTMLSYVIGAKFGGKGTLREIAVVIAWHGLATQAMAPAMYLGMESLRAGQAGPMLLALLIMLGVMLWMFASFIAEAHRFPRVAPVIGVTLAVSTVFLLLVSALLAGLITEVAPVQ